MRSRLMLAAAAVALVTPVGAGAAPAAANDDAVVAKKSCTLSDPRLTESSGLVATDTWWATANDSGDAGRVFVLTPGDCSTVGVTTFAEEVVDVEALAPAPDGVWVGDIGDNLRARPTIRVYRVGIGPGDRRRPAQGYDLVYPEGPRDAEALLAEPDTGSGPGRLVVVTKEYGPGFVYVAPRELRGDGPTTLAPHPGRVLPLVTDGAFFPDGRHLVLRNYTTAAVYSWPELDRVGVVPLPAQRQGEAIAVDGDDLLLTSEGAGTPVLRVALPAEVRDAMDGRKETVAMYAGATSSTSTSPSTGTSASSEEASSEEADDAEDADGSRGISLVWYAIGGVLLGAALAALRRWRGRRDR